MLDLWATVRHCERSEAISCKYRLLRRFAPRNDEVNLGRGEKMERQLRCLARGVCRRRAPRCEFRPLPPESRSWVLTDCFYAILAQTAHCTRELVVFEFRILAEEP